eukprot:CAMPEP_0183727118 /NCGR_PEP_ID=MMETSP0737-20130205/24907_1 /TAXON_ID=385413 /ORGANISM="Thalassiosira miniscula, Strain CCMP1093" /LENGTH=509 /DNA_ID=CAMNT_0025958669 /DNA_START=53 /DNA_END=1582 /DNA_ORIENTATION=-
MVPLQLYVFAIAVSSSMILPSTAEELTKTDEECISGDFVANCKNDTDGAYSEKDHNALDNYCNDAKPECKVWANVGECEKNPGYMLNHCPLSCNSCSEQLSNNPSSERERKDLLEAVAKYGKPQRVEGDQASKTFEILRKTIDYMQNEIYNPNSTLSRDILEECTNREELCAFWAAMGECEANKAYMKIKCAPSCQTCKMIDMKERCPPLDQDVKPGLLPGELNAMFERIVDTAPGNHTKTTAAAKTERSNDGYNKGNNYDEMDEEGIMRNYTVHIHSRPTSPIVFSGTDSNERRIISKEQDLDQPPWVITFENFMSREECNHLIKLGYAKKYQRSEDVGSLQADGSYSSVHNLNRTSENAWCSYRNNCRNDTIVQRIYKRMAMVTGIPANYSESLQLLKYETGQFYRSHHDYTAYQRDRRCGPRILTFFLYLSDVEEGGATNFPELDIAVKPKAGRALLWPSVLNSNPKDKEPRTDHEAQDVIKGTKFGANAWIHLHDYLAAQELGCT